ncbi:MAG: nucleotidyltransferase domain-containing protein [bacterium]|nr:nucleotidyltransferase domain-containing protein [bacterium]
MNEETIKRSVAELKKVLTGHFGSDIKIFLFGSVARNDYEPDSDIDILVLFPGEVDTGLMEEVIAVAYDVELEHDVVFGIVVQSNEFWASEKAAVIPFHQNLQREALRI